MNEMVRRVAAVNATRERFAGRPFAWGSVDCARVAAWHLRQFGHRASLAKAGSYKSAIGAKRALARLGHERLRDAVAALGLIEVPVAAAWTGDLLAKPGSDGFDAIGIVAGNSTVLGFYGGELAMVRITDFSDAVAWRV